MALDLLSNGATTTVTAGGTSAPSAGTIESWTVTSSAEFPAASNTATPPTQFRVVDPAAPSEIMLVTNVSGTTWTVTRGAESTTGLSAATTVAHSAGFTAMSVLTTGALLSGNSGTSVASVNSSGVFAGITSAEAGDLVFSVKAYGAYGDAIIKSDGDMSAGTAVLTSASGSFVSTDVGKQIIVNTAAAYGSLTTALASGTAYTSLATTALTTAISSGNYLVIGSGATAQVVQASATAAVGATSISVHSFTANANYAIGTPIDGEHLITTISAYTSATQVTLAADAAIAVSGVRYVYGHDDSAAVANTITAALAQSPLGGIVFFPAGNFLMNNVSTPAQSTGYLTFLGAGELCTTLFANGYSNQVFKCAMPGFVDQLTVDSNQTTTNGWLFATGMVGQTILANAGATTLDSTTVTVNGNQSSTITAGMVITVVNAGTPTGNQAGQSAPLTTTVVSSTYNSGPNNTSVVVVNAAGTTTSARQVAFGSALIPISRIGVGDITVRGVGNTSQGYDFQVDDPTYSFPFLFDELRIGHISAGPSYSQYQESVNISMVNKVVGGRFAMEGVTGRIGPNFYAVNTVDIDAIDIIVGGTDATDTLVLGSNFGSLGQYNVNNVTIVDPNNVAQPVLVYVNSLNAVNWQLPNGGTCYVDLNQTGNNCQANFTNCELLSGVKQALSPMTLNFLGGKVGVYGTGGCISNPNSGTTGPITADGTTLDLNRSASSCIVYSTSASIAPEMYLSNCKVINAAGTAVLANQGTVSGWVQACPGLNPFGYQGPVTVGASPWTYTNTNPFPVTVYVLTGITGDYISMGGVEMGTLLSGASLPVALSPGQAFVLTYTGAVPQAWVVGA